MEIPISIISILIGLALCFCGFKIKKIGFFIVWFVIGYNLISQFMPDINTWIPQIADSELFQNLLPIAGGLLLGLLGFTIEKLCVAGMVLFLAISIGMKYFGTDIQTIAISAIIGAILAACSTAIIKPAIIVATAIAGSYTLTTALISLLTLDQATWFFPILIIIAAIGALVQFSSTKGETA